MSIDVKVAVYGSLKEGFHNHAVLGDSKLLGTATVEGFDMYSLGTFPAILGGEGSIQVEVYQVTSTTIMQGLDYLEGYRSDKPASSFYIRRTVDIEGFGECFIYVYNGVADTDDLVESGVWEYEFA